MQRVDLRIVASIANILMGILVLIQGVAYTFGYWESSVAEPQSFAETLFSGPLFIILGIMLTLIGVIMLIRPTLVWRSSDARMEKKGV